MERPALILLDTHALIWLAEGHSQLGEDARRLADEALKRAELAVAAISFWETAMLQQRSRISLVQLVETWRLELLRHGLIEIPMTGDIGIAAVRLTDFHQDPADRIIVATSTFHRATLITADEHILNWSGSLSRQDARR